MMSILKICIFCAYLGILLSFEVIYKKKLVMQLLNNVLILVNSQPCKNVPIVIFKLHKTHRNKTHIQINSKKVFFFFFK